MANAPVSVTVSGPAVRVTGETIVDPLSNCAENTVPPTRRELGVKPVPLIVTPFAIRVPATTLVEPTLIAGVPKIVRIVLAELLDASVTVMLSAVEVSVEDTMNPTGLAVYKLPVAPVTTVV